MHLKDFDQLQRVHSRSGWTAHEMIGVTEPFFTNIAAAEKQGKAQSSTQEPKKITSLTVWPQFFPSIQFQHI